MKTIMINKDKIILELSNDELGTIGNGLNEVCNGIKVHEFDTLMGTNVENARIILNFLRTTYIKADQDNSVEQ